jgi:hypothetical protein
LIKEDLYARIVDFVVDFMTRDGGVHERDEDKNGVFEADHHVDVSVDDKIVKRLVVVKDKSESLDDFGRVLDSARAGSDADIEEGDDGAQTVEITERASGDDAGKEGDDMFKLSIEQV